MYRTWRGNSVNLVGKKLQDILGRLKREVMDEEVELVFMRRVYAGKAHRDKMRCRLVGINNGETGRYHLYVTNVPPQTLST